MEGDCNVYAHSSLWMRPTRPDRYNMRMVYTFSESLKQEESVGLVFDNIEATFVTPRLPVQDVTLQQYEMVILGPIPV